MVDEDRDEPALDAAASPAIPAADAGRAGAGDDAARAGEVAAATAHRRRRTARAKGFKACVRMSECDTQQLVLWLIPAAPLAAAIVTALVGPKLLRERSHWPCWIALAIVGDLLVHAAAVDRAERLHRPRGHAGRRHRLPVPRDRRRSTSASICRPTR